MSVRRGLLLAVAGGLATLAFLPPAEPPELAAAQWNPQRWRPGLYFVSSVEIDEDALTLAAEAAWVTAMRLLGEDPDDHFMGPITVYVCKGPGELYHRYWSTGGLRKKPPGSAWYSRRLNAIFMSHRDPLEADLCIAHEITHHAVRCVAPDCPSLFNEGLACLVPQIALNDLEHAPALLRERRWWAHCIRRAILRDEIPRLHELMSSRFQARPHLNYPLAWCLAEVLAGHGSYAMRTMMGGFGKTSDWMAFCGAYPEQWVAEEWNEELVRVANDTVRGADG